MQDIKPWKVLKETAGRGPAGFMRLIGRTYELPNGNIANWDILQGGQTVGIVAFTADNQVILAKQFRPGPAVVLDEVPGGYIDKGEEPLQAAARELKEETGYQGELKLIGYTWQASNSTTKRYVALARNCQKISSSQLDSGEDIQVTLKDLPDFITQVRNGELTDADLAYMVLDREGLL